MTGPFARLAAPCALLLALAPNLGRAQAIYQFVPIADTTAGSGFVDLGQSPNLNAAGVVALTGRTGATAAGVFTGTGGGSVTPVVDNAVGSPAAGFATFDTPRVNGAGAVVFRATSADGSTTAIFGNAAAGGAVASLVDNSADFLDVFSPAFNNTGQVAFSSVSFATGDPGVFRREPTGGTVNPVGSAPVDFSTLGPRTFLNPAGTVALVAARGGATSGTDVLLGNAAGAPVAAVTVGVGAAASLASIDLGFAPHLSDDGQTVTFLALRTVSGSRGIFQFTLGNAALTPLVETGDGLFSDVTEFSLAGGQFAFLGTIAPSVVDPDGTRGLFNGANPVLNRIVAEGDLLPNGAGLAAVNSLAFADGGLNASGQVAFYAGFANNTAAVFRADVVPEPGSVVLLLVAGGGATLGLAVRRHRRRRRQLA